MLSRYVLLALVAGVNTFVIVSELGWLIAGRVTGGNIAFGPAIAIPNVGFDEATKIIAWENSYYFVVSYTDSNDKS